MVDNWPSYTDELGRKTTEVLDKWSSAFERGNITKREYYILITGLYDATSGLIEKSLSDLMADIHASLRKT